MRPRRTFPALLAVVLLAGCSGEERSGKAASPRPVPEATPAAPSAAAPSAAGTAESHPTADRNTPPEIRSVRFAPPDRGTGSPLGVLAEGYDADGDPVRFEIAWQRNGEPAGEGERLYGPARGGDRIRVSVTPYDGKVRGRTATLNRVIRSSVAIVGMDPIQADGNVLSFRIHAKGDSGTPLIYSLKDPPSGMRIDPATGVVRWETATGTEGKVPFDVTVSDGAGAEATARFTVTVREDDAPGPR